MHTIRPASGPAREPSISCEGVTYVYPDGTCANEGIDLSIGPGEIYSLLGPNGAGKTTLIQQIATNLRPTRGRVRVLGRPAHVDPAATKRRLGLIPQSAGLFDGLSVEQHLAYFGPLKELDRAQTATAVERVIDECGLGALRRNRVAALSGGQQRMVLVALALLADPPLLVLDEPTVGLDPVARRFIWEAIRKQRASGKTILLTTHYMEEAEALADRVGFLDRGRVRLSGTLRELFVRMGRSFRVTLFDEGSGATLERHYFDTLRQAQDYVRGCDSAAYAVGRVTLEDIYLRLLDPAGSSDAEREERGGKPS